MSEGLQIIRVHNIHNFSQRGYLVYLRERDASFFRASSSPLFFLCYDIKRRKFHGEGGGGAWYTCTSLG